MVQLGCSWNLVSSLKKKAMSCKTTFSYFFIVLFCLALFTSCNKAQNSNNAETQYANISDERVRKILKRAIDRSGGIENWKSIKTISYTKRSKLLYEGGSTESDITQRHKYTMRPEFSAEITWVKDGNNHLIRYTSSAVSKQINGEEDVSADPEALKESVMSALYTLGMPYKLLDKGTSLDYEGIVTLDNNRKAEMIKATYSPGRFQNHSTSDVWYYYFDVENGEFLSSWVYHQPTYAYIKNLDFHTALPVKLYRHRKSFRSDSLRNIKFLRAEFWYSDFEIEMIDA